MFITIDPYYDIKFYNSAIEAMRNNGVEFSEFISVKSPYHWFLKLDQAPVMVNYDTTEESKWLVSKVIPNQANQEYLTYRRSDGHGKNIAKYINNIALAEAHKSDFACFFSARNSDFIKDVSKKLSSRIYYFGKYLNGRYRVCLTCDPNILVYLNPDQVLLEKDSNELGRFEAEFNTKVLLKKEFLVKYYEVPYVESGIINIPTFQHGQKIVF